jgi:predicted DNA-binding transcriptional regulator AlpA
MTMVDDVQTGGVRQMLTAEQVLELIPFSRATLFRLERDELFPKGVPITPQRKLWFEDEVLAWQRDVQDPASALALALAERVRRHSKQRV